MFDKYIINAFLLCLIISIKWIVTIKILNTIDVNNENLHRYNQ